MSKICSIFLLLLTLSHLGAREYKDIKISPEDANKLGISTIQIKNGGVVRSIPFNAVIDFDSGTSITQSSTFDAIVVALHKQEGEKVKKGEVICEISSNELNNLLFELGNTQNRYKIAEEISQKDKRLYESGVISQREYQVSYLNANELRLKLMQIQSTFNTFGIDPKKPKGVYGFRIIAKEDGVLAVSPRQTGEKIIAFSPYIRITSGKNLLARIRVPIHMIDYIRPKSKVFDKNGKEVGVVSAVSVVIDKTTNTVIAIANLNQGGFKVGEVVELYIEGNLNQNSLLVPVEAIIKNENDYLVFKKTKNGYLPIKINILEEKNRSFIISASGLNFGDEVAIGSIIALKGIVNHVGE